MKAYKKAKKGTSLKAVPKENKGLSKLPTSVRNKMGYAQKGGVVKGGVDPKRAKELMDVMKKSSMQVRNVGELPFDSDPSNPAGLLNYVNSKLSNKIQAGNAAEINFVKKYRESMLKNEGRTDSPKMKHGGKVGNPPKKKIAKALLKGVAEGAAEKATKKPKMGYKKTVKALLKGAAEGAAERVTGKPKMGYKKTVKTLKKKK